MSAAEHVDRVELDQTQLVDDFAKVPHVDPAIGSTFYEPLSAQGVTPGLVVSDRAH
jgi:hypothetical protein